MDSPRSISGLLRPSVNGEYLTGHSCKQRAVGVGGRMSECDINRTTE